ncbi:DUF3467 domain-containing protein [Planctomicrobium sp. SH661]|uniref:DUF3467 domain-containing protein n=1 Tax=Planctomicrobium sp. SH661 TaxID=3448124 RepID=UPI003F5BEDD6
MSHSTPDDEPFDAEEDHTVQGQVRHHQLSARVPDEIGNGVFSNGVMILTGPFELVLDFVLRMGEQQRIAARVVLPHIVGQQFINALHDNLQNYERRFGPIAQIPRMLPEEKTESQPPSGIDPGNSGEIPAFHPENLPAPDQPPHIEDIYNELKLPDSMLSGRYANGVLIRHSPTEFCFDFITNVYPRSAVSARVFLAAPHVVPFLKSLTRALHPPADLGPPAE